MEGMLMNTTNGSKKKQSPVERSTTILLVKNLPFTTDEMALSQLFRAHGELHRFVLPPSKTMALVEVGMKRFVNRNG
jgi:multiple RNA-binding domain-containing protein 1